MELNRMTEGRKDRTTKGKGESSKVPLFQSAAIISEFYSVS